MGVFVKVCGCASGRDTEAVAGLKPDALGFIFWPGSKRAVAPKEVAAWVKDLPSTIKRVGVFVNADKDVLLRARDEVGLDILQLHGEEPVSLTTELQGTLWKAVHLNRELPDDLDAYRVSALMVDHHGGIQPGGTGVAVDWDAAARFVSENRKDVILAGGLTPDNVTEALATVKPWGVDVSSGVEKEPGVKDMGKVKEFIQRCRKEE